MIVPFPLLKKAKGWTLGGLVGLTSLLVVLSGTGCVYMLEKPPRETWKAQAQSQARALQANRDASPILTQQTPQLLVPSGATER